MAILLRGKARCPICGKVIGEHEGAILFPHFVLNEFDPLHPLSDSACHSACVEREPVGKLMLAAFEQYLANTGPGRRRCIVCNEEVTDPDDYFLIGYLGDPAKDPLGTFNYTHLHKSHISLWEAAAEFLAISKATLAERKWQGPTLQELVQEIEDTMHEPR